MALERLETLEPGLQQQYVTCLKTHILVEIVQLRMFHLVLLRWEGYYCSLNVKPCFK